MGNLPLSSRITLFKIMCPLQPSCQSRLHRVSRERRRLEIVIWQRCYDNMVAAISTPITSCSHSNSFHFMVHWVSAMFFYDMVETPVRHLQCFATPSSCTFNYKQRTTRFACSFVSHATPIRMVHQEHLKATQTNAECCKLPVDPRWQTCIVDFSILILNALNHSFFDNRLRVRNITTPQHIVKVAQAKGTRRLVTMFYDVWLVKQTQRLHHMLALSTLHSPPPVANNTLQVDDEEVYVEFLDSLLQ